MSHSIVFTTFMLAWAAWWGALHTRIRKNRVYARGRANTSSDAIYKLVNPLLFAMQVGLSIATFWVSSPWLLTVHDSDALRTAGITLFCLGSGLYGWAVGHLGEHYSPCYDTHAPTQVVRSGPYRSIRHPMYAAKLILGVATGVVSGSLWFLPTTVYFFAVTLKATFREDRALEVALPEYREYKERTSLLIPGLL